MSKRDDTLKRLTGRQRRFYEVLRRKAVELGMMYLQVFMILWDKEHPDRISLAAHAARELMDKLPEYFDAPTVATKVKSIKVKVNELQGIWNGLKNSSGIEKDSFVGQDGKRVKKFFKKCDVFFAWWDEFHEKRSDEVKHFIRFIERQAPLLPEELEKEITKIWMDVKGYFNDVAHHDYPSTEKEFVDRLVRVEMVLMDRLIPATVEELDEMAKLVSEAEGRTNA